MTNTANADNKKNLIWIYAWLVGLTLAEVGIVVMGISKTVGVILMAGTTVAKVLMIALHFMHMKHDRPLVWLLPAIPVALAVFFVLVLFPDLVWHQPLTFH